MMKPNSHQAQGKPSFASIAAKAPTHEKLPILPSTPSMKQKPSLQQAQVSLQPLQVRPSQDLVSTIAKLDIRAAVPTSKNLDEQARSNIMRAGLKPEDGTRPLVQSVLKNLPSTVASLPNVKSRGCESEDSHRVNQSCSNGFSATTQGSAEAIETSPPKRNYDHNDRSKESSIGHDMIALSSPATSATRSPKNIITDTGISIPAAGVEALPGPEQEALLLSASKPVIAFDYQDPDTKLMEALETPKDRMFVLRLEQELIEFIGNSTQPLLHLAPSNSFCRLLAHKLADYYGLTHVADNSQNTITIYRTPHCQLRPQLLSILKPQDPEVLVIAPLALPMMKIMRRPDLIKAYDATSSDPTTTSSSAVGSQAASERSDEDLRDAGTVSPLEPGTAKEKGLLTRAEREARYKEKREEIFGPPGEGPPGSGSTPLPEESRTSSRNEERRRKKKNNRFPNDDFEARSQYNAFYPPSQYPQNPYDPSAMPGPYFTTFPPNVAPQHHNQYGMMHSMGPEGSTPFQGPMVSHGHHLPSNYQSNNIAASSGDASFRPYAPSFTQQSYSLPQYNAPMSPQTSSPPPVGNNPNGPVQPHTPTHYIDQGWSPPPNCFYPDTNQTPLQNMHTTPRFTGHAAQTYHFGPPIPQNQHLASQNQHPLPGSFSRLGPLNPQIQAFVPHPAAQGFPTSPMSAMHGRPTSNGIPQGNNPNYGGMQHQHTNAPPMNLGTSKPLNHDRKAAFAPGGQGYKPLSKWTPPANLPQKPPPPAAPGRPDSLPSSKSFSPSSQLYPSGQMPSFQNGIYMHSGPNDRTKNQA